MAVTQVKGVFLTVEVVVFLVNWTWTQCWDRGKGLSKMLIRSVFRNARGFTLIELLSVMVIMAVLGAVGAKRFGAFTDTAELRASESSVTELNVRETLTWFNIKMSVEGWTSDDALFAQVDKNLGPDFVWTSGPTTGGGMLNFRKNVISLKREPSTVSKSAQWQAL